MTRLFVLANQIPVDSAGQPYPGAKANFYLTETTTREDVYADSDLSVALSNPVVADAGGAFVPIYLDPAVTYRCILTDADDVQISDSDPIQVPEGGGSIAVVDAGGYFTATTVEGVLQEIGAGYAVLADDEDVSGNWVVSGSFNFQDNILQRPMLRDFSLLNVPVSSAAGTLTLNLESGCAFTTTLTENTTIALSNPVAADDHSQIVLQVTQDGAGGAYTVTWPASVLWPNGTTPVMTTTDDAVDIYVLRTWDAGTTWYGSYGQAFG